MKKILSIITVLFFAACMPSTPVQSSREHNCPEKSALVQSDEEVSLADQSADEEGLPVSSCAE